MRMRSLLPCLAVAAALFASAAHAETKIFIIASNSDGYGVDRCLATGESCGKVIATSYCQSQQFAQARTFYKIDRDEITGAVPNAATCKGPACSEFVAIECAR